MAGQAEDAAPTLTPRLAVTGKKVTENVHKVLDKTKANPKGTAVLRYLGQNVTPLNYSAMSGTPGLVLVHLRFWP